MGALCLMVLVACGGTAERQPRVLFLRQDDVGRYQLFVSDSQGESAVQLTAAEAGIFDYAPAHDGHAIALTWGYTPAATELWQIDMAGKEPGEPTVLLECRTFLCQNPVWAHDNRRIVYERRNLEGDQPELWWLDSLTGDTIPVFNDATIQAYYPQLSADDRYLSFVSIPEQGAAQLPPGHSMNDGHNHGALATQDVTIFELATSERLIIPNLMNSPTTWRPAGDTTSLLVTDMVIFGERFGTHLFQGSAESSAMRDLTDGQMLADFTPSWSPDGSQIAFTRKEANTAMGRQLWLMDADGGNATSLTENANWHHGEAQWSFDGTQLLFQRFDGTTPSVPPALWLHDVATGEEQLVIENGVRPKWLR